MLLPLNHYTVLEYSDCPAATWAGLRFTELGARVIKWGSKDAAWLEGLKDMHTASMNRDKELIQRGDQHEERLNDLLNQADVLLCRKADFDLEDLRMKRPELVVVEFSAWGPAAEHWKWAEADLLVQAISGLAYTTGSQEDMPTPFAYNIADYICGNQSVQFVLAALFARIKSQKGCLIQLSLIESILDFQFEFLTTYYQSGKQPVRAAITNANAILSAPYGIYRTKKGFIAIAMMPLARLNQALECDQLKRFAESDAFIHRDEIKSVITSHLLSQPSEYWLQQAKKLDLWIMPVLSWQDLIRSDAYRKLNLTRTISRPGQENIIIAGMPIRFINDV